LAICRRSLAGGVGGAVLRGHRGFGDTATATWKSDVLILQFSKMEKWRNGEMEKFCGTKITIMLKLKMRCERSERGIFNARRAFVYQNMYLAAAGSAGSSGVRGL